MTNINEMPQWAKDLAAENEKLKKDISMFKEFAGRNKILSYEDAQTDKTVKYAHFKVYNNKLVIGWSDLDLSEFDPSARTAMGENIMTFLFFADGTKEKVNYIAFKNVVKLIKAKILSRDSMTAVVQFDDDTKNTYGLAQNTLEVPIKFCNA